MKIGWELRPVARILTDRHTDTQTFFKNDFFHHFRPKNDEINQNLEFQFFHQYYTSPWKVPFRGEVIMFLFLNKGKREIKLNIIRKDRKVFYKNSLGARGFYCTNCLISINDFLSSQSIQSLSISLQHSTKTWVCSPINKLIGR